MRGALSVRIACTVGRSRTMGRAVVDGVAGVVDAGSWT